MLITPPGEVHTVSSSFPSSEKSRQASSFSEAARKPFFSGQSRTARE